MTAEEYRLKIDEALAGYFNVRAGALNAGLAEAMRYSLLAGGKRIRPLLVLEFCRIAGRRRAPGRGVRHDTAL